MTPAKAKVIFATHMQASRKRILTEYERKQLAVARQTLRGTKKAAMNPKRSRKNPVIKRDESGKFPAYAWPGGYPIFYHDREFNVLCPSCANKEPYKSLVGDINYEDDSLYCDECSKQIESAYGENPYQASAELGGTEVKSPKYDDKHKARRWAQDARIIARRTKTKIAKVRVAKVNPRRNAPGVLIYGKVLRITAVKTQNHICDAECKAHGHKYFHDFKTAPKMYGLADGSLLIKS